MSISIIVLVPWLRRVPGPSAWASAASSQGFNLRVPDFDPSAHTGTLPVTCEGVEASFEYYHDPILAYLRDVEDFRWHQQLALLRFGSVVELVTHSRADDRFAAVMASAVLTISVGGRLLDCSTGTQVGVRRVMEWARNSARPPNPASLRRREATVLAVHGHTMQILESLGYQRVVPFKSTHPGDLWAGRPGRWFRNELVEASVYSDGDQSSLCITFYGTPFDLVKLQADGISGNAGGSYLFTFLSNAGGGAFQSVLPQNVPVTPRFPASATAVQLERELRQADPLVFAALRRNMEKQGVDNWPPDFGVPGSGAV